MKKRRRKPRAPARAKRSALTRRPEAPQLKPAIPQNRSRWRNACYAWWYMCKRAAFRFAAVLAVVATGYTIWEIWIAIRPEPVFSPGNPSFAQPLDVPFSVTNTSVLFTIYDLEISCVLIDVRITEQSGRNFYFDGTTVGINTVSNLNPQDTRTYTCPLQTTLENFPAPFPISSEHKVFKARIGFDSKYSIMQGFIGANSSGSSLTFESGGGFPRGPACASLGHAPWYLNQGGRCGS